MEEMTREFKKGEIVQLDADMANSGTVEVVRQTPLRKFTTVTDGRAQWDVMTYRLSPLQIETDNELLATNDPELIKQGVPKLTPADSTNEVKAVERGLSIVGSSRRNGFRESDDFYPTPRYAVEELLKRETFDGNIWECACGEGDISEVFKNNGFEVFSSDLINRGYGEQLDFLQSDLVADNIVTNPPYKLALDFVLKAKKQGKNKIAMFLKTVWLESESRYQMFQDKDFPLKNIYQFSKRVTLYKGGVKMKNSGMISYAWYVWEKGYVGKPTIEWISGNKNEEIKINETRLSLPLEPLEACSKSLNEAVDLLKECTGRLKFDSLGQTLSLHNKVSAFLSQFKQ